MTNYTIIYSDAGEPKTLFAVNDDGSTFSFAYDVENPLYVSYEAWLAEGNTPNPYVPPPEPAHLTPQEKLAAAGLSVTELKELLGIK